MPFKTLWHTPNVALYAELIGDISEDEMIALNADMRDNYVEKGDAPVHLILDANGVKSFPRSVRAIQQAFNAYLKHPAIGRIYVIGYNNVAINFITSAVTRILGIQFKQVSSLEEAERLLSQAEPRVKIRANRAS